MLRREDERQTAAYQVIDALDLLRRWSAYGRPVVVGSVAYGLVVEPDIDVHRAALDGGVRSPKAYEEWIAVNKSLGLTTWRPT